MFIVTEYAALTSRVNSMSGLIFSADLKASAWYFSRHKKEWVCEKQRPKPYYAARLLKSM